MSTDFLERLAETAVPAIPDALDRQVHERLNRVLVLQHLADFCTRGLIYTIGHLLTGLLGVAWFSLTGRFNSQQKRPH